MGEFTHGNDISVWQDDNSTAQMVNFEVMKRVPSYFVGIKVSQGMAKDSDFVLNWRHAKDAGILRFGYQFFDWRYSYTDQIKLFCDTLQDDPGELPPCLDFEMHQNVPSREVASKAALDACDRISATLNRQAMLYTGPSYFASYGSRDSAWLRYLLWIANYTSNSRPVIPAPWTDWTFWQWGLGKGLGPRHGCESLDVDMNWFNGSVAQLYELAKVSTVPNVPEPEPEPEPVETKPIMKGQVLSNALNVRRAPRVSSGIAATLTKGDMVDILEIVDLNVWARIGKDRWVAAPYLRLFKE